MLEAHRLDKTIPIPLYFQLKQILLDAVKSGEYPVDSMIPTEKELSEMFDISRTTVRQAVTELVREGWLYRIASKGTFVARRKIKQDFMRKLEAFDQQIARTGRRPGTQLLEMGTGPMPEAARERFGLGEGGSWVYLHRRRFADDDPIVTVQTWLPLEKCAYIMSHDFGSESLYGVLSLNTTTRICRVTRILEAVPAAGDDAKYLNLAPGEPVLLSCTIGYNRADEPIEDSIARYRGDCNRFEVDLIIEGQ